MTHRLQHAFCVVLLIATTGSPPVAHSWNASGHMVSGVIAYQVLKREQPTAIERVKAILQRHPWWVDRWQKKLATIHEGGRDEMLFMLATRWADDIRTLERSQHRGPWHYINFPFAPPDQSENVAPKAPAEANILTALAENEEITRFDASAVRPAIALTWLFHLVGDVHQPLHTAQLFSNTHPNGDRGGNEICVRPSRLKNAINLHAFWDSLITTSSNIMRITSKARSLLKLEEFTGLKLSEFKSADFEVWAKESFELAVKDAYQKGGVVGTPKGTAEDCGEVRDAAVLPSGYARNAGLVADRRIVLAGFRLAALLRSF